MCLYVIIMMYCNNLLYIHAFLLLALVYKCLLQTNRSYTIYVHVPSSVAMATSSSSCRISPFPAVVSTTLLLHWTPLWQWVLYSMPFLLHIHLRVLQVPGLQLQRFFVKEFHGDCCRAASRTVIRGSSSHPFTGIP